MSTATDLSPDPCCVLVPVGGAIEPACERGLRGLEAAGYQVRRIYGYSQIDVARNAIASDALRDGFEETFWIDSDIDFLPADVQRIRQHEMPICCGLYPKKGKRELAAHVMAGTKELHFGQANGGLNELLYVGAGFLHIRKEVYTAIQAKFDLPVCDQQFGTPSIPYFQPMIKETENGSWYLGEDYAFCERARQCGYSIMADTRIRLRHFGKYGFSWEDAGSELPRFREFRLGIE